MFRSISKLGMLAGAGFQVLAMVVCGQTLQSRPAVSGSCPRTHIRLTVRTENGLPVGALKARDFRVHFPQGTAAIVSIEDGTPKKTDTPDTDILFVVPPFSDLNDSITNPLMQALAKADNFKFKLAVLAPDGSITPFTSDLALVRRKLTEAVSMQMGLGRDAWPAAEQKAYLTLRALQGRHVIVNLMAPSLLHESVEKRGFRNDMTLDWLALYDMTQVYRLVTPVPLGFTIPGGDASGEGSVFFGGGSDPAWQLQQLQAASAAQDASWAVKRFYAAFTGGRAEDSIKTLLQDVLADSRGTYDLIVKPHFECRIGEMYSVTVSTRKPGVRIFAPSVIQMLPITLASP
jgi:hypothetical protein